MLNYLYIIENLNCFEVLEGVVGFVFGVNVIWVFVVGVSVGFGELEIFVVESVVLDELDMLEEGRGEEMEDVEEVGILLFDVEIFVLFLKKCV